MVEDRDAATKLMAEKITTTNQVALYANLLSTKEADNLELQRVMKNLQG